MTTEEPSIKKTMPEEVLKERQRRMQDRLKKTYFPILEKIQSIRDFNRHIVIQHSDGTIEKKYELDDQSQIMVDDLKKLADQAYELAEDEFYKGYDRPELEEE